MNLTAGKMYRGALRQHWLAYLVGILSLLVCSISEVTIPKFIQWSMDLIAGHPPAFLAAMMGREASLVSRLHGLTVCMLLVLLLGFFGRLGWRQLLARRTHLSGRDLKVRFWHVLRRLPLRTFHDYPLGDLMNRATGDWNATRAIHGFTLVQTLDLIFFAALSVGCMWVINWRMTLFCLALMPFLPRPILRLARRESDLHASAQDLLGKLSDVVTQSLATIRLQRATHSDAMWQLRLQKAAKDYSEQRYEVVKTGWMIYPLGAVSTLFAYAVLLFWGVRLVRLGQLSIGEFVALQSYVLMLQGPLTDMGDCIAEWQRGFASFARMVEIFNLQSIADRWSEGKVQPPALAGLNEPNLTQSREASLAKPAIIEVNDLRFAFPKVGAGRPVFENLTLAVRFGENIGICGPLGSGKSTLLSLLAGLIEAPRGRIQLAGTDICELDHSWLANHVAMVPQRAFLFAGTIRYSLELDATYPEQELWRVLEVVRLAEDVRRFPDGLDSWVGEWGVNLSGGQKQRLALARALLRERSVLLLDDCLSAVDAVTEEAILLALKSQLHRVTVVWVAHRLSTLKLCDRVYRLADGSLQAIKVPGLQATVDEDHHDSYSH